MKQGDYFFNFHSHSFRLFVCYSFFSYYLLFYVQRTRKICINSHLNFSNIPYTSSIQYAFLYHILLFLHSLSPFPPSSLKPSSNSLIQSTRYQRSLRLPSRAETITYHGVDGHGKCTSYCRNENIPRQWQCLISCEFEWMNLNP